MLGHRSATVRFAFIHDMGTTPVEPHKKPMPQCLVLLSKNCSVDWIQGWSDDAIMRAIKLRYMTDTEETNAHVESGALPTPIPEILFQIHRMVEQAVVDSLDEDMAMVFPPPLLVNDFVSCFLLCATERQNQTQVRTTALKHAVEAYERLHKNHADMKAEHAYLVPLVKGAVAKHLQVREEHLNYSKIAARARRIAEDEETSEVRAVLYGDAPGPEIMHEYEVASNAYLTAVKAVADLQSFHMVQLEVLEGFEDLVQLLLEAITIVFGMDTFRTLAPVLQKKVSGLNVNSVGLTTVKRLRAYVADTRFTPEKYFSINKAAGILCNWVRAVERYGRAHEWINPASQSNTQQSLDRVRELSKNPIMAIESFEAGVKATKVRETEAVRKEEEARHRVQVIVGQLEQSNLILNALTPEKVDWNAKFQKLEECSSTLIGDSILYSAYVTYLTPFPYAERCAILQLLAEALAQASVATSPQFGLGNFYAPLELDAKARYTRDYTCKCLRENCLTIAACPKIPLLIDPVGYGLQVLLSASGKEGGGTEGADRHDAPTLHRFAISDKVDVRSFLEEAKRCDRPALIENVDELMPEILSVLRSHPHLLTGRYQRRNVASVWGRQEVSVRLCEGYSIMLSTSRKTYVPPADAFYCMSLCDLTPDSEAMEEISLRSIIQHLDEPAHVLKEEFWRESHHLKDAIRDISEKISLTLRSFDIVAQVNGLEADDFVSDCTILMQSRGRLQKHTLAGMEVLRGLNYFEEAAKECAGMVATSWEICAMSGANLFGLGLFIKGLMACPSVADLQRGSVQFKNAMQATSENIVQDMMSTMLLGLPRGMRHLALLIIDASQSQDGPISDFKSALQFFAELLNSADFALLNAHVVCTRGTGTAQLFSKLGWKVFRDSRPYLGNQYALINSSMDLKKQEWTDFVFSPDLSLRLPCTKPSENEHTVENLLATLSLAPYKLAQMLRMLTEREFSLAQVHLIDKIQDCAHFSTHFASKILTLLTDNDVPIWMAVSQAMFHFAVEDAEHAPPALPLFIDEFTTPKQLAEILETASTTPCWVVAKVPMHGGGHWYSSLVRHMVASASAQTRGLAAKSRLCVAVEATSANKASGVLADSIAIMAENLADPRQLLGAIIADCFHRGMM